ncbi:hypothetical protein [Actinomadura rubrisoli]|uniref:Uncharacterized protein n=1 Tax=Actinomadura rubrisoli TaxID=2530368 RepID=A0A4R5AZU7_9ACTN|nr:hypothetical protein [Actinomadura rubrisoli]TDD77710.1 hypothetical protein E1298_29725 [Actinomadura rubrisoli]
MSDQSPATELLAAARLLRETAVKATPGPWTAEHSSWAGDNAVLSTVIGGHAVAVCGEEVRGVTLPASADAAWIALMGPDKAEPLATFLHHVAETWVFQKGAIRGFALAIARAVTGRAA